MGHMVMLTVKAYSLSAFVYLLQLYKNTCAIV